MAILVVSREFMSGAEEICQGVAHELKYDYIDKDRILADMQTAGEKWRRMEEDLDESGPSLWERYDQEYRGFIALIESYIYQYAVNDNVVIMGRAGNLILAGITHALRVRFIAPLEKRVEQVMAKELVAKDVARWLVEKADKARAAYVSANYGRPWDDMSQYDMVINTGTQTPDDAKREIVDALGERGRLLTNETRKALQDRALVAKIKARIITHPHVFVPTLEVTHTGEAVILKGVIHNAGEHHLIENLARDIAHPVPVRCELHYRG